MSPGVRRPRSPWRAFAGDEAALAYSREDGAVVGLRGGGEQGCYALEGLALRAFEALGEVLERFGFDTD